ncbi:MAG: endonuclease/exonuclease/phosphatase family protein [Sulfuricurvum sp.]|jgi:endonuclease/exonuclease/phosphatase family metal-dependent hydrolase|uniref:endonuclease/exonuclease/phosphatase family protein n=1 Tax=Sulfuricurvum sp. TaxID=2025608 RepID=UPI0025CF0660|nr:endonuclease/exonuclease/phosphatase family protein [Sulfuricurvum sp.]MCK9373439.1 endonuclease/exonuclease/phosphatase family protein [Sulfuricurvum sp.]
MRLFWLLFIAVTLLGGAEMKIATYNVENLFDTQDDGNEYEEYIPNTAWGWDETMYRTKLRHSAQVIRDIGADIIGLEEIESETALKDLKAEINRQGLYYPYYAYSRSKNTTVSVAMLSRYPIQSVLNHPISASREFRDIMEVKVTVEGKALRIFVNHWKSKSGPESMRIQSARVLAKRISLLDSSEPFIILGDLNSHYEEYRTFLKSRRHNDTDGITGINHILKTVDENHNPATYPSLQSNSGTLYNLWYDLPEEERWSHQYRHHTEALDHIIISPALADGKGIEYIKGSMRRFAPEYLFQNGKIYRWQQSRKYPKHHLGEGYSDHLPIYAQFRL